MGITYKSAFRMWEFSLMEWERGLSSMEIALQRIEQCVDGRLDLSHLGLTELPPLPPLTVLRCSENHLTSLPPLPDGLVELHCYNNHLSSLPTLPSSLQLLSCSSNQMTFLPALPVSLTYLGCQFNQLTSLPPLPPFLDLILCDCNRITSLPEVPLFLTYLSCSMNQLTSLPSLPHGLQRLYCSQNPLETLPELPSSLAGLACELPHNGSIYISNEMTPDRVQQINRENQEWVEFLSMKRCMERCCVYYQELMHNRWNPDRVIPLHRMGYNPSDI